MNIAIGIASALAGATGRGYRSIQFADENQPRLVSRRLYINRFSALKFFKEHSMDYIRFLLRKVLTPITIMVIFKEGAKVKGKIEMEVDENRVIEFGSKGCKG